MRRINSDDLAMLNGRKSLVAGLANLAAPELMAGVTDTRPWAVDAVCAQIEPDLFFPEPGEGDRAAQARAVCQSCSVIEQCRAWAVVHNERGVWGGLGEQQRRALRVGSAE